MLKLSNKSKPWRYLSHIFLSIDQLGNALAGGNPDNTVSARVGYYNHHYYDGRDEVPWYWSVFEKIIDTTFYPVDGPGHCHEAYHNDAGEVFDNRVTNFLIAVAAALVIIPSCIAMALILYFLSALRIVSKKKIRRDENLEKRLSVCTRILVSTNQEIVEHRTGFDLTNARHRFAELEQEANVIDTVLNG